MWHKCYLTTGFLGDNPSGPQYFWCFLTLEVGTSRKCFQDSA